jgi:FkbM family methyltransferase
MRFIYKILYRLSIKRSYTSIDRIRYLKRLRARRSRYDYGYYSEFDKEQFSSGELLIRTNYGGKPIRFHCSPDNYIEHNIIKHGLGSRFIVDLIVEHAKPGSIVVDVGANIGSVSIPVAAVMPECEVYAFEPNPSAMRKFRRNLALNHVANLHAFEIGIADSSGTLNFHSQENDLGVSSFLPPDRETANVNQIEVRVDTLDNLSRQWVEPVSVIKVDVEGFEVQVLRGAATLISEQRPIIIFEHWDSHFSSAHEAQGKRRALKDFLSVHGYCGYYITRYDPQLLFPADFERPMHGDVLAIPDVRSQ